MRIFTGKPINVSNRLIGRVTKKYLNLKFDKRTILVLQDSNQKFQFGHCAFVTDASANYRNLPANMPGVAELPQKAISSFREGDVLSIEPEGLIQLLWQANSFSNVLFVTNACNCRCLMCPQKLGEHDEMLFGQNIQMLKLVKNQQIKQIGITGGEPTLRIDDLHSLISLCKKYFPKTELALLTNGKRFKDFECAKMIAEIKHPNLIYCVSLNSDIDTINDEIMGSRGSFKDTVQGLHNLALLRQLVEIRVVIMKHNYQRLPQIAEFIYRNFPFAIHIAFMGMETHELAAKNLDQVWADPFEYRYELMAAVQHLNFRDLNVSIYNLPLCLIPPKVWSFAKDSISDWKKTYLKQCNDCTMREKCPGVFSTSKKHSEHINPIK